MRFLLLLALMGCEAATTGLMGGEHDDAGRRDATVFVVPDASEPVPDAGVQGLCGQGTFRISVGERSSGSSGDLRFEGTAEILSWLPDIELALDDGRRVVVTVDISGLEPPPRPIDTHVRATLDLSRPFWTQGSIVLASLRRPSAPTMAFAAWSGAIDPPGRVVEATMAIREESDCVATTSCGDARQDALRVRTATLETRVGAQSMTVVEGWTIVNADSQHFIAPPLCEDQPGRWASGLLFRALP